MDLGQPWLRLWIVGWKRQAVTWTNADKEFIVIHSNQILTKLCKILLEEIAPFQNMFIKSWVKTTMVFKLLWSEKVTYAKSVYSNHIM